MLVIIIIFISIFVVGALYIQSQDTNFSLSQLNPISLLVTLAQSIGIGPGNGSGIGIGLGIGSGMGPGPGLGFGVKLC